MKYYLFLLAEFCLLLGIHGRLMAYDNCDHQVAKLINPGVVFTQDEKACLKNIFNDLDNESDQNDEVFNKNLKNELLKDLLAIQDIHNQCILAVNDGTIEIADLKSALEKQINNAIVKIEGYQKALFNKSNSQCLSKANDDYIAKLLATAYECLFRPHEDKHQDPYWPEPKPEM